MIIPNGNFDGQSSWSARYGTKHRLERIVDFPRGVARPKKVRIYWRLNHYVLQWWDPAAKRTLSDRVDGDLVAAITRTRQIEERLDHFRSGGQPRRKVTHDAVITAYVADLGRRADAGEIDPKTVRRYRSALQHYQAFAESPQVASRFPSVSQVNREFVLEFAAHLQNLLISPNGHPGTKHRRMAASGYVEDVVRSMLAWAADPERGNLLPDAFRNPFAGSKRRSNRSERDLFGEPDITIPMAAEFLKCCDEFQLSLFSLLVLYGLRAAEPCHLFHEQLDGEWLMVGSDPQLDYFVKGRRDKRFPLIDPLAGMLRQAGQKRTQGLLLLRRPVLAGTVRPPLVRASRDELYAEFERRCRHQKASSAQARRAIRDRLLHDAGALKYDDIEAEFGRIAHSLNWPRAATIKDLRHLFATSLENAGMPEFYRRYLMGHSPGKTAVASYTHLDQLRTRYLEALRHQMQPLVDAISSRSAELHKAPVRPSKTA